MVRFRAGGELPQLFFRLAQRSRAARPGDAPDRISIPVPDRVDWDIHRIATSRHYSTSLVEIQTEWSLDDLYEAHDVLDMYDALDELEARTMRGRS